MKEESIVIDMARFKRLQERAGMSDKEIAKLLHLKKEAIYDWKHGYYMPRLKNYTDVLQIFRDRIKNPVNTIEDIQREAAKLGLSYGVYMSYLETGYLETFRKLQAKEHKRMKHVNIIESNLLGAGSKGSKTVFTSSKL